MLALLVFVMTGCAGQMQIDTKTTIKTAAGAGALTLKVSGTGLVGEALRNGNLDQYIAGANTAGMSVRRYIEGEQAVLEVGGTFSSVDELNALQKEAFAPLGIVPSFTRSQRNSFFSSSTSYQVSFDSPSETPDANIESSSQSSQSASANLTPDIILRYDLTVPGKVTSTNAVVRDGTTLTWTLSAGQVLSNSTLDATSRQSHPERILGIVLTGCLAVFLVRRRLA